MIGALELVRGPPVDAPAAPVPLRGRQWLQGSDADSMPDALAPARGDFPRVLVPRPSSGGKQAAAQTGLASTAEALPPLSSGRCVRAVLDQELSECPAVLLRGLPGLTTPADFSEFMKGLGYRPKSYSGGSSSRGKVEQDVYTAADDPPAVSMGLHNEMADAQGQPPAKVIFFCVAAAPPACGGETPISDSRDLLQKVGGEVDELFRSRGGVRYSRYLADATESGLYTWQGALGVGTREAAEAECRALGWDYQWDDTGGLIASYVKPHDRTVVVGGEATRLWWNHAHLDHGDFYFPHHPDYQHLAGQPLRRAPTHATYGDGTEIDAATLAHLRRVIWGAAVAVTRQPGDVLVLDNDRAQHGRMGWDPAVPRRLVVALTED